MPRETTNVEMADANIDQHVRSPRPATPVSAGHRVLSAEITARSKVDEALRPTVTECVYGSDGCRSTLHVAAALPGENLGRIRAAGERVGRIVRIRRHARERH
ncbi:ABC transporter ATP-binding protein [Streptomyces azureus]|uniref:ABC transporter ATP-binding protein n=1 Tax=Streptomyces azureus TaxID=146537 RepID=A0A0K8PFW2_STRAJ|nr:ABC transporter ATP-binding protein [Streptomyces azureus]